MGFVFIVCNVSLLVSTSILRDAFTNTPFLTGFSFGTFIGLRLLAMGSITFLMVAAILSGNSSGFSGTGSGLEHMLLSSDFIGISHVSSFADNFSGEQFDVSTLE